MSGESSMCLSKASVSFLGLATLMMSKSTQMFVAPNNVNLPTGMFPQGSERPTTGRTEEMFPPFPRAFASKS